MATGAGDRCGCYLRVKPEIAGEGEGGGRMGPRRGAGRAAGRAGGGVQTRRSGGIAELGSPRRRGRRGRGVPAQEAGVGGLREAPGLELSLEPSRPSRPWEPGGGGAERSQRDTESFRVPLVL